MRPATGPKDASRCLPWDARRRTILDAARTLLVERGFQDVLLDDVARKARISKGTVYLFFKDKEHMFAEVLADVFDSLEERLGRIPAAGDALENLKKVVGTFIGISDDNEDLLEGVLRHKHRLHDPYREKLLGGRMMALHRYMTNRVDACIRQGVCRRMPPSRGAIFLGALLKMDLYEKSLNTTVRPFRERVDGVMELFLWGAGPRKRLPSGVGA